MDPWRNAKAGNKGTDRELNYRQVRGYGASGRGERELEN